MTKMMKKKIKVIGTADIILAQMKKKKTKNNILDTINKNGSVLYLNGMHRAFSRNNRVIRAMQK